ncbi:hypothetical protein Ciccas_004602 [Cichlidogyrus casuarinus]|uniref:Uncharacterized protein n=1 Tax=Cichlidogyrus casuarinus TaxID=1844966 RepID=A0ABD2QB17_9PLAT
MPKSSVNESNIMEELKILKEQWATLLAMQERSLKAAADQEVRITNIEARTRDMETAILSNLAYRRQVEALSERQTELAEALVAKSAEFTLRVERKDAWFLLDFPEAEKDSDQIRAACLEMGFPKVLGTSRLGQERAGLAARPRIVKIKFAGPVQRDTLTAGGSSLKVAGRTRRTWLVR